MSESRGSSKTESGILCTKTIAAKGAELQSAIAEMRAALHEHAQFLEYVTVRATREVAEKTSSASSNAA